MTCFFMSAKLKQKTIDELKKIIERDYKVSVDSDGANSLGVSILRLARLSLVGIARAKEKEIKK